MTDFERLKDFHQRQIANQTEEAAKQERPASRTRTASNLGHHTTEKTGEESKTTEKAHDTFPKAQKLPKEGHFKATSLAKIPSAQKIIKASEFLGSTLQRQRTQSEPTRPINHPEVKPRAVTVTGDMKALPKASSIPIVVTSAQKKEIETKQKRKETIVTLEQKLNTFSAVAEQVRDNPKRKIRVESSLSSKDGADFKISVVRRSFGFLAGKSEPTKLMFKELKTLKDQVELTDDFELNHKFIQMVNDIKNSEWGKALLQNPERAKDFEDLDIQKKFANVYKEHIPEVVNAFKTVIKFEEGEHVSRKELTGAKETLTKYKVPGDPALIADFNAKLNKIEERLMNPNVQESADLLLGLEGGKFSISTWDH